MLYKYQVMKSSQQIKFFMNDSFYDAMQSLEKIKENEKKAPRFEARFYAFIILKAFSRTPQTRMCKDLTSKHYKIRRKEWCSLAREPFHDKYKGEVISVANKIRLAVELFFSRPHPSKSEDRICFQELQKQIQDILEFGEVRKSTIKRYMKNCRILWLEYRRTAKYRF